MRQLFIISLLIILTGCGTARPWTNAEKVMLGASWIATGADAYTTVQGLNNGCSEANPIVGSDPSNATVIGFAVLIQLGFWAAAHFIPEHRIWILGTKTIISGSCAVWNSTQY